MNETIKLLDHGYFKVIESWGSDARIVEAARMSSGKGFLGWGGDPCPSCLSDGRIDTSDGLFRTCSGMIEARDTCACKGSGKTTGDEKLLKYLYENKHSTPFEMAGKVIEIKAPISVFRQWHRHRTQCLAGSTELHFDLPGGVARRGSQLYKRTIQQVVEAFERSDFARNRIRGMLLRGIDEDTHEVTYKHIVNAWRSGVKDVYDVTLGNGVVVRMSAEHRVHTDFGWKRLRELEGSNAMISSIGAGHAAVARSMPEFTDAELLESPPQTRACDGTESCRRDCAKICSHAEQTAITTALVGRSGEYLSGLQLIHAKTVNGELVAGGGPSCWQCSRLVVEVELDGVWLYEDVANVRFERMLIGMPPGMPPPPGRKHVRHVSEWRYYTALDFHRATLKACGLHDGVQA